MRKMLQHNIKALTFALASWYTELLSACSNSADALLLTTLLNFRILQVLAKFGTLTTLQPYIMKNYRIEAIILAIGTLMLGVFIYWGLSAFAAKDRVVDVRGLAEREVKADKVIWPITYKTTGNDLQTIYTDLNNVNDRIAIFLTSNGVAKTDISVGAPQIVDLRAERYGSADDIKTRDRYNVTSIITVSSSQVDVVRSLMSRMGELLKQGIAISANDYDTRVQYEFTSLNKIKPQMIEEATKTHVRLPKICKGF